jgi:hypothetical protein
MTGYNLATYRAHILRELEGFGGPSASHSLSDATLFGALNEAQRQIQEDKRLLQDFLVDIAVSSGTRAYAIDPSAQGRAIRGVWFRPDTSTDYGKLTRISYSEALEDGLIQDTETGTPTSWCVDEASRQLLLLPTPDVTLAAALQMHIDASPRALWRIVDSRIISRYVSVTEDSLDVVLTDLASAETAGAADWADCELGILSTDLESRAGMPVAWNEISAVNTHHITLKTAYEGVTNATASFLIAQVSDWERAHPGKLGYAMADLACAILKDASLPERAAVWRARANEILGGFRRDEQGQEPRGRRTARTTPFFNR